MSIPPITFNNKLFNLLLPSLLRERFMSTIWSKQHFVWDSDLHMEFELNIKQLESTLFSIETHYPYVSCLSTDGVSNPRHYTRLEESKQTTCFNPVIDPVKLLEHLDTGSTIRLKEFDQYYPKLKILKKIFIEIFKCPISFNVYLNNKANGINPHFDVHHIFIVQLEGEKIWEIGPISEEFPRYDFSIGADKVPSPNKFTHKIKLIPGNILYLPIGLWHKTSTKKLSLHLAIGIMTPDWTHVLKGLINYVSDKNPDLKQLFNVKSYRKKNEFCGNLPVFENVAVIEKALELLESNVQDFHSDLFKKYVLLNEK